MLVGSQWDFYRVKISIALPIQSLDPIRSLDHSLSTRLIPAGAFKFGCAGDFLSRSLFTHLIPDLTKILPFEEVERQTLAYALKVMDTNVTQAAQALKMSRSTLYRN